jgi:hypothetical protein
MEVLVTELRMRESGQFDGPTWRVCEIEKDFH